MKVICKNSEGRYSTPIVDWVRDITHTDITRGKTYDVLKVITHGSIPESKRTYYRILNDVGEVDDYCKSLFDEINVVREIKIDKILNNE